MKKINFDKIEFSTNNPTTEEALQDVEPFLTFKEIKQICTGLGIAWDENATKATLNGKPVDASDIVRVFNVD